MGNYRFRVFRGGDECRIPLHCRLEPEPIHIYLNVGMCLMIGESLRKGQKGKSSFLCVEAFITLSLADLTLMTTRISLLGSLLRFSCVSMTFDQVKEV